MARMIYIANTSLDGYTEDREGNFDWSEPDEDVFRLITDLIRPTGTHLYGRRMYETMLVWETEPGLAAESPLRRDFAETWQAADKLVYSRTLQAVSTRRTQIVRDFDPEATRQLKEAVEQDILIGGPELAAQAFRAGLIDECHLFIAPISLGGGKPALPANLRLELELLEERRFGKGAVYLRHRTKPGKAT
jgi:dihydrofolate reductase